jgi:hypothetical protein
MRTVLTWLIYSFDMDPIHSVSVCSTVTGEEPGIKVAGAEPVMEW